MNKEYMEFTEKMRRGIESVMGKEVKLHAVKKNNGVVLYGITIYTEGCNIMPTLYLESYYEDYKNGKPIKDVACEFMREYDRSLINENFNVDFFEDYEQVKPLLGYKLINTDMNVDLLKEVPHKCYLNLAIVCYCNIVDDRIGKGTILIRNEHLDIWGIKAEKLIKDAVRSMKVTNPPELINMAELLKELYDDPGQLICGKIPMWVLTSKNRQFGAAAMVYGNWLEYIGDAIEEDYYVLPSSIHEVIILPKKYALDKDDLVKMVREINEEQVDTEELLANNIYYYNRDTKELQIFG